MPLEWRMRRFGQVLPRPRRSESVKRAVGSRALRREALYAACLGSPARAYLHHRCSWSPPRSWWSACCSAISSRPWRGDAVVPGASHPGRQPLGAWSGDRRRRALRCSATTCCSSSRAERSPSRAPRRRSAWFCFCSPALVTAHLADAARRSDEAAREAAVARRSDELKTALLRAVTHDLRTPLASIKASVSALRQTWRGLHRRRPCRAAGRDRGRVGSSRSTRS